MKKYKLYATKSLPTFGILQKPSERDEQIAASAATCTPSRTEGLTGFLAVGGDDVDDDDDDDVVVVVWSKEGDGCSSRPSVRSAEQLAPTHSVQIGLSAVNLFVLSGQRVWSKQPP